MVVSAATAWGARPRPGRRAAGRRLASLASLLVFAVDLALVPALASAAEPPPPKEWEVEILPYGWLAMLHGQVETSRFGDEEISVGAKDVLDAFDLGAMGSVSLRWRRVVALFDVAWAKISTDDGIGNSRVRYDVTQEIGWFEALLGYRVYQRPGGLFGTAAPKDARIFAFDVLGGLTYSWLDLELDLSRDPLLEIPPQEFKLREKVDWVAPYLAFRFRNDFTDRLAHETLLGVGGFGAGDAPDVNWQVTTVLSYAITRHLRLTAGYRALAGYDPDIHLITHGPLVGVGIWF